MPIIAQNTIKIEQPIEKVFKFISNMENFSAWFPKVIKIVSIDDTPHGLVGKKYLETVAIPGKGETKIMLVVIEIVENSLYRTQGNLPKLLPQMTIKLNKTMNNSTEVNWKMASRNTHVLFQWCVLPMIRIVMGRRAKQGLTNLKKILERTT